MTVDHQPFLQRTRAESAPGILRRVVREAAVHDWVVLAYLLLLNAAVLRAPAGPVRTQVLGATGGLLAALVAVLLLVRGGMLRHGLIAPLAYRTVLYGTVQASYFILGDLLPLVNPTTLDTELFQLDAALFGFEPALYMDRWVNPITTEWFSFFYFGYFFLLALHVIPMLLLARHRRLMSEFAFGMLIVFCVGHSVYMIVPGFGPYRALADSFQNALPAGLWHDTVMSAVSAGGAQKDIFPSLHTAAPTFITLFSFRNRDRIPFRWSWPLVAFFTVNIIIATMFLRWHYVIDIVAGLLLATLAITLGAYVARWEAARRDALGLTREWPLPDLGKVSRSEAPEPAE